MLKEEQKGATHEFDREQKLQQEKSRKKKAKEADKRTLRTRSNIAHETKKPRELMSASSGERSKSNGEKKKTELRPYASGSGGILEAAKV